MKKLMIIDGGPRRNFNTASMLQKFAEGAASVSDEIEVKTVRLYGIDYKGCMSCMACKIRNKASNVCKFKDALTPVLQEVAEADGLVLGPTSDSIVRRIGKKICRRHMMPAVAWLSV